MYNIGTYISNGHGNTVYRDSCGINHFLNQLIQYYIYVYY